MDKATLPVEEPKKKILILSSKGGYGHAAASLSIQEICKDQYVFQELFPIEELNRIGGASGESFYNALIKNNWIWTTNFLSNKLAPLLFLSKREKIEGLLSEYIQKERPDLILSLIPFINYPVSEAARKQEVPYLLVTTDNDLTNWVRGLHRVTHPSFTVTIGQEHALTRGLLQERGIAKEQIVVTGFPIHPVFLQKKEKDRIKQEMEISLDKPVVMIMMGGAGGKGAYAYAKELKKIGFPLHVVICTGNNRSLYEKMESFSEERGLVSFSVLQFTSRVSDLMQVADLLITKPGPGTINEAIMKKLPILVDNVHSALSWERVNLELVEKGGFGRVLNEVSEVNGFVSSYLQDAKLKESVEAAYQSQDRISFDKNIQQLLENLLLSSCKNS
jgi:processive 1,2-diacylglycerol beta-glucosyltransferase